MLMRHAVIGCCCCRGAKPILREGGKFPAFSLHLAPALQPLRMLTGPGAAKELASALKEHPRNAPPVFPSDEVSSKACSRPLFGCVQLTMVWLLTDMLHA